MASPFSKGLISAVMYYAIASLLTWLTYQVFGHDYMHAPGLYHLIGFLALVGGVIWIIVGTVRLILNRQDKRNIGALLVNVIVIASTVTFFAIEINSDTSAESSTNKGDVITIHMDSSKNSSSIVDGYGDTILLKVGDSTVIDKTKNWATGQTSR